MLRAFRPLVGAVLASLLATTTSTAQGERVNFEVMPVKPLALATVDGQTYLLVCNTPDNSVEIYDTRTNAFLQRVQVGLRPVTVVWHEGLSAFYTANFLGDSISAVSFRKRGAATIPTAELERTSICGDEPTDIAIWTTGTVLFVTLQSRSAMAWLDAFTLAPIGGVAGMRISLTSSIFDPQSPFALKHPRRIFVKDNHVIVMGQRGGNAPAYDFDVWSINLANLHEESLGGLGSTNWNMTPGSDGKWYVVGGFARNGVNGATALKNLATGFVRSELTVVSGLGAPNATKPKRDLNLDHLGRVRTFDVATAQPTDVALLESGNTVTKVFVCGFSSDRIQVLHPNGPDPTTWPSTYIQLPNASPSHARTGPRALLVRRGTAAPVATPPRLYCLNALNQSVSVIDPATEQELARFPLQQDPTEQKVHDGREFLYSAEHSGHGFVSCSSCHTDATTDGLAWNLGTIGGGPAGPIPQHLVDGVVSPLPPNFPSDKGPMVTQTLQGLVDHPTDTMETQYLFTNAPYHWRADKPGIADFNEAFVNLQGKLDIGPPGSPEGITHEQMARYIAFVNTIMYPPNPEESYFRRYNGDLGDPNLPDGTGALRGMKLFHTHPIAAAGVENRSCVQCHFLPEGSNNHLTEVLGQPIETAATRGLFQREAKLELDGQSLGTPKTSQFGLLHPGPPLSLNTFIFNTFNGFLPDPAATVDMMRFMREFDWGTAPIIGGVYTVDVTNVASGVTDNAFMILEGQVELANGGCAALVRSSLQQRYFWYDVTASPPGWREEGTATVLTRQQLRGLVTFGNDRIVLQGCEVGAERRIANPSGQKTPLTGPAPSQVTLEPMLPASQWRQVPLLTKNWKKGTGPNDFNWSSSTPEPISVKASRIYQQALIAKAPQFGIATEHHEAPRRFSVAGVGILPGARLLFAIAADATTPPPYASNTPIQLLYTELFPTTRRTLDGRQIWETTLEADPVITAALLLGGPFAPDVAATFLNPGAEPPTANQFDPLAWNWYHVAVLNEDNGLGDGGWQRLTVQ